MMMNRLACGLLAAVQLAGAWMAVAQTATAPVASHQPPADATGLIQARVPGGHGTGPAITISVRNLDFGAVTLGSNNELSFKIRNVGAALLTGTATVSSPFSILSGSAFVLKPAQTQVITVQYAPTSAGMHMTVVHLTGASIAVAGSAAPPARKAPTRPRPAPTQPNGLRFIA
jgi:hypothetical protein